MDFIILSYICSFVKKIRRRRRKKIIIIVEISVLSNI